MYTTPSSRHSRTYSPPLSTAGSSTTFTQGQQTKLNIVTRLAIEGKAKKGQDGAAIKIYMKLSVPMDNVTPGSTIPLFPEENLKILTSQVHPIDINSVPYNFSSTTCPLLNHAARALNLPARSQKSYLSVFGLPTPAASIISTSSRSSSSSNTSVNIPPLDDKYTGHILVSGYNVSYILPREFPPRFGGEDSNRSSIYTTAKMRRGSIGDRNNMHFMAAIDLWVPYLSRPPRSPYLLSIPIPRCLSNNIKLRIFPPNSTNTSSSMASLSSAEEDPGSWELTSDPHVTRTTTSRSSRTGSYADMADDESSDSSTYADGCAVQGTFPSADRIRVRWAAPLKSVGGDGRQRVGVKDAKGEMTCLILGKAKDETSSREGILMRVEYKGTCKGVWFPGVATMLGMDIGLEAKGSDVVWAAKQEARWTVSGGPGFTGSNADNPSPSISRNTSLDFPQTSFSSAPFLQAPAMTKRADSSSSAGSTTSLLRAPLPADHLPEYSFEGSPNSLTPMSTLSSIGSTILSTPEGRSRASSDVAVRPPAVPLTVHINMNDILPPTKPVFTFSISGVILVITRPRPHLSNGHSTHSIEADTDPVPIVLPKFSVLAADVETTSTIIRNEAEGANVEVYNIAGDLRDAQTRRTVLQAGGMTRCGNDGGRIALRSLTRNLAATSILKMNGDHPSENGKAHTPRSRTTSGPGRPNSGVSLPSVYATLKRKRDGQLVIPSVVVNVTPLSLEGATYPNAYAVLVSLPVPCDSDSDWLEFGFALSRSGSSSDSTSDKGNKPPRIDITSASVDGVTIRFELSTAKQEDGVVDLDVPLDKARANNWITWVRVHAGDVGGQLQIDYVVTEFNGTSSSSKQKGKEKAKNDGQMEILIPSFSLPVGRLEVNIETPSSDVLSLRTNIAHRQLSPTQGYKLLHFSLEEFFCPTLSFHVRPIASKFHMGTEVLWKILQSLVWVTPAVLVLMLLSNLGAEFRQMRHSLDQCTILLTSDWEDLPQPPTIETVLVTTTTTIFSPSTPNSKPQLRETASEALTSMMSASTSTEISSSSPSLTSYGLSGTPVTVTPSETSSTSPSSQPSDDNWISSLSLFGALPFPWPLQIEIPPGARKTIETVVEGFGIVWQVFRKVYHYPLDPP
ncbi:hypothetical protein BJ138DRAFT_1063131 [Hygrophoropsis aurantiaca]|uniref:Uncharacterized protein n=1 Tax=Hygrophoropsis aurantiaca TaxID=72124 RepID=A0ACB8ADM0_9AGAM|nr:hypothetical protein BJ138DRAFT_1063131 [Hygrophoropsis aurantiaca]